MPDSIRACEVNSSVLAPPPSAQAPAVRTNVPTLRRCARDRRGDECAMNRCWRFQATATKLPRHLRIPVGVAEGVGVVVVGHVLGAATERVRQPAGKAAGLPLHHAARVVSLMGPVPSQAQ